MALETEKSTVLVVEDDRFTRELITFALEGAGYRIQTASTGKMALEALEHGRLNAAVLDIRLPDMEGTTLCQEIRQSSSLPILFLTAIRSEESLVDALALGGDDYLVKPFSAPVLVARMKALLRRSKLSGFPLISVGPIRLNLGGGTARVYDEPISLTPTEFRMLTRLCQQPNQVVSARALLDDGEAYGLSDQDARSIAKVHVRHLRQKIEPFANGAVQIATIRGAGYGLRVSPEQSVGPTF